MIGARVRLVQSLVLLLSLSCGPDDPCKVDCESDWTRSVTITQGVCGCVRFLEGDFMPSFRPGCGRCGTNGTVTGVSREMRFYEATTRDQVEEVDRGAFFRKVLSRLVATTRSNDEGFFQVRLPPGRYTVFAVEDSLLYSNFLVSCWVVEGQVTRLVFDIDYLAGY